MSLIQEIEAAQTQVLREFGDGILKDIRDLEIQLDDLRMENSKKLENLTNPQPLSDTDSNLYLIGCKWLESFSLMHIIGLKAKIDVMAAELHQYEESQNAMIPQSLRAEKAHLLQENHELKVSKQALLDELAMNKREIEREKELLRKSIK